MPKPSSLKNALRAGAVLCAATFASLALMPAAHAADEVKFALNWIISGRNAGYFVALEKGYYKEGGMDVQISRGRGSGDTLKRVAIGESAFGLVDTATVLTGKANDDLPVKMIAMTYSKAATAILYAKESGITKPKDLEGRTVARSAAGSTINMWPAFLKVNGIDRSKIKEVTVTASSYAPMLLSRQVDAVLDQSSYMGRYQKAADAQKLHIEAFRFSDFGYDLYGDAIVASDDTLKKSPDLAKRFLKATLKGNLYAFEHPDEAVAILAKYASEAEPDVAKAELLDTKVLAMTDEVKKHGYGYIDAAKLAKNIELIKEPLEFKRPLKAEDTFSLDYLK
jgi:NitT/TauT family transport system substrate-binding protein